METKHFIYVYTNRINNKKYVGQTSDIKRRCREHKCDIYSSNRSSRDNLLARAMRKYGEDVFDFEILESDLSQEQANELEVYWITKLDTKAPKGYNIKDGGKNASVSRFSQEEIEGIKEDIKQGSTYSIIEKKWGIGKGYVSQINHGFYFYDENETYPLCKKQLTKEDESVAKVIDLLKHSKLTLEQIGQEVGMCKASVTKINNGTYHYNPILDYPIRMTKLERNFLAAKALKDTDKTIAEIAESVGLSKSSIHNINIGKYRKFEGYKYPIR